MSPQDYISSGIIEQVLLGAATAEETAEMWRMAEAHPEIAAEITAVEETLAGLAQAGAVTPALDWSVIDAVTEGVRQDPPVDTPPPATAPQAPPTPQSKLAWMRAWAVIVSLLLLGSLVGLFLVFSELGHERKSRKEAEMAKEMAELQFNACESARDSVSADHAALLRYLKQKENRRVEILALAPQPGVGSAAMALYDEDAQQIKFLLEGAEANENERFVLWAVNPNGSTEGEIYENLGTYDLSAFMGGGEWLDIELENPLAFGISIEQAATPVTAPTDVVHLGTALP